MSGLGDVPTRRVSLPGDGMGGPGKNGPLQSLFWPTSKDHDFLQASICCRLLTEESAQRFSTTPTR